jgi:hypothetical protein
MATLAAARDVDSLLADGDGLEIFACEICAKTFAKRMFSIFYLRFEVFRTCLGLFTHPRDSIGTSC